MSILRINAHFDGQHIQLDEKVDLPLNARLIVTVLSDEAATDQSDWSTLAKAALARAYGENEPEYGTDDIRS